MQLHLKVLRDPGASLQLSGRVLLRMLQGLLMHVVAMQVPFCQVYRGWQAHVKPCCCCFTPTLLLAAAVQLLLTALSILPHGLLRHAVAMHVPFSQVYCGWQEHAKPCCCCCCTPADLRATVQLPLTALVMLPHGLLEHTVACAVQTAARQVPLTMAEVLHAAPSGKLTTVHNPVRGTQVAFWHVFSATQGVWLVAQ